MRLSRISAESADATIRRLGAEDAEQYHLLNLEALERHPEAFAADLEEESARSLEEVRERLERQTIYGAFDGGLLIATVTFHRLADRKRSHVGMLWGLYVTPAYRKHGIARRLIEHAVGEAARLVDQVELYVEEHNRGAIELYRQLGFEQYGLMRRSLRVAGRDHNAVMMVRILR